MSLSSLTAEALRANPDLSAARRRYEAALRVPGQVGTLDDPRLSIAYSPKPAQSRAGPVDYKIAVEQALPFYGVLDLREEAARRMAESAGAEAEATEFDIVREVKLVFFDWIYARRALEINEINRGLLTQFQRIAEQRYRAGLVPQSDPLKAAVALAKIDAQDATFRRMEEVAKGLLNTLLNRAPQGPLGTPAPEPLLLRRFEAAALAQTALASRPELSGARARVEAEKARLGLARKDYWPNFVLGAEYAPIESGTNPLFPKDGDDVITAKFGINIPIQLGRRGAALEEAAELAAAAESRWRAIYNRVLFEVHDRQARFHEARDILELYRKKIVPAAKLELDATRNAYENARVDFLNLLDSERSYEEILLQDAAAARNYKQEEAHLERAIGAPLPEAMGPAPAQGPEEGVR